MYDRLDDIVALATIPGKSALNVVRLSGTNSERFFSLLTKSKVKPTPNKVYLKYIYSSKTKDPFDFASLVYYKTPKSFTGEDSLEISVHGGVIIANKLIETVLALGAREALPGEFSYRAFCNNKIDLLQAEAISSIVEANNSVDSYYLLNTIKGGLSKKIQQSKNSIEDIIVQGEHEIDFTEEEMSPGTKQRFYQNLKTCQQEIKNILAKSYTVEKKVSGLRVAIIGFPNVGKSSLFNLFVGKGRSIVTNEKGTTRDTVEADVHIDNAFITLIDTAGLRKTSNKAEMLGIKKTHQEIKEANILIIVDDNNPKKILKQLDKETKHKKILLVLNKTDLKRAQKQERGIHCVSCKKTTGINELLTDLLTLCKKEMNSFSSQYLYLINQRQLDLLKKINTNIKYILRQHQDIEDLSACLSDLYVVRDKFDSLIKPSDKESVLHSIFKGFCVGK